MASPVVALLLFLWFLARDCPEALFLTIVLSSFSLIFTRLVPFLCHCFSAILPLSVLKFEACLSLHLVVTIGSPLFSFLLLLFLFHYHHHHHPHTQLCCKQNTKSTFQIQVRVCGGVLVMRLNRACVVDFNLTINLQLHFYSLEFNRIFRLFFFEQVSLVR